jgi:hypothetical protein
MLSTLEQRLSRARCVATVPVEAGSGPRGRAASQSSWKAVTARMASTKLAYLFLSVKRQGVRFDLLPGVGAEPSARSWASEDRGPWGLFQQVAHDSAAGRLLVRPSQRAAVARYVRR